MFGQINWKTKINLISVSWILPPASFIYIANNHIADCKMEILNYFKGNYDYSNIRQETKVMLYELISWEELKIIFTIP